MKTKTTAEKKEPAKNESNLGLKRGCKESLSQRTKQTLGKEKARIRKTKETPKSVFEKKGLMDKKQKMDFWKGRREGKPRKKTE